MCIGKQQAGISVSRQFQVPFNGIKSEQTTSLFLHPSASITPSMSIPQMPSPRSNLTSVPFECSHVLDINSLQALHHDDDEDLVHQATSSYLNKQRQRHELLKSTFKPAIFPGEACAVCGDLASGIHFSVWSCNGCKTFFRRVIIENRTYSCKRNGDCPIDKDHRCSCRACRFRKCLKMGMDSSELNIERRRKRKIAEISKSPVLIEEIEDPLIRNLVNKERQFIKLLTSTTTPIHPSIQEALVMPTCYLQLDYHERNQMKPGDQMNFSYWRAKILSITIELIKSFDEFTMLSCSDKEAMIVHSCFSILVFSEAFHTPERYTDRIVFPDGLSGFRNLSANIIKEQSGLIPTVVAVINHILVPIRRMQVTEIEYVMLCAIIMFDPECLSLSPFAVRMFKAIRTELLISLRRHLDEKLHDKMEAAIRLAELLLRISNVHKVAAFKRETLCTIETFNLMSPHPLTMEISKKYPDVSFF